VNLSEKNLQFLSQLAENNNKEWFEANKPLFQECHEEFKLFHEHLRTLLSKHDQIGGTKTFRIYRDVRFSKDKTPYKTYWSGTYKRATDYLRGGYYYQVEPGKSYVAGGFFGPNSQDLLHLRKQISQEPEPLQEVLESVDFKRYFGSLQGEKVKTTPKGFSAEDQVIDLLRHKQFLVYRYFVDEQVLDESFADELDQSFRAMRSYFDVMSTYLTTDLNGISLL
jgi:uncharacterized protein (TIGR02453 family)